MSVAAVADVAASQPAYFSASGLNAYYGDSYIVQNVSFEVKEGEIVALLGRNGAGKTSTLRAIARAESPELRSGQIWLGGQAVHEMQSYQASNARHSAGA
jgi:branched-chain amino acid transport system ATP-binding protein